MTALSETTTTPGTRPAGTAPGVGPARLVLTPPLVLAVAATLGTIAGFAVYAVLNAANDSDDGWESLGYAVAGAGLAALTALVVGIVGLIVLARLLFLPGHRAAPVVLALAGPFAPLALGALLAGALPSEPPQSVVSLFVLAALAAPSLAFLWCGSAAPTRGTLLRGAGVVTALAVVGSLVLYVVSDARADEVVADLPLVLFDGASAESPNGWRRDAFTTTRVRPETAFAPDGHEAYLKYLAPGGVAFLTMRTEIGECSPTPVRGYTCRLVGSLPAGELRSYVSSAEYAGYPDAAEFLVLVYPDGSGVSMNVDEVQTPGQDVLSRLQRVDRERFEDATNAELALSP